MVSFRHHFSKSYKQNSNRRKILCTKSKTKTSINGDVAGCSVNHRNQGRNLQWHIDQLTTSNPPKSLLVCLSPRTSYLAVHFKQLPLDNRELPKVGICFPFQRSSHLKVKEPVSRSLCPRFQVGREMRAFVGVNLTVQERVILVRVSRDGQICG